MLNGNRFQILHNAVFSESGEDVPVFGAKHEAFSIVKDDGAVRGTVTTLAINDLTDWLKSTNRTNVMIKLDVEGAENAAIDGIGDLGGAEILLIYEDHGSDREHNVSKHLKEKHGYQIFYFHEGFAIEISDLTALDEIKTNRRYGYDLIATKSLYWLGEILKL